MNILETININDFNNFQLKIKNKEFTVQEENIILDNIVNFDNISFLSYLLDNENLLFIDYEYLTKILIKDNKYNMFSLALDRVDDYYNTIFTSSLVFNAIENNSFECAKILLEHEKFDIKTLTLELLNFSALKNNDFCFNFILNNISLNEDHNISNLIKICIQNQNKTFLDKVINKVPNHNTDFSYIYNSFRLIKHDNLKEELEFMVTHLDLSGNDNKLLKRYINSNESEELSLIVKNKAIKESLTEKWLYQNCKYKHVIDSLKTVVLQNKISKF